MHRDAQRDHRDPRRLRRRSRPPRRSRCRSTRPSPMRSTAPTTARPCSTWRPRASATAASATRPTRCWSGGSPRCEGGVARAGVGLRPGGAALRHRQRSPTTAATSSPCRSSTAPPTRCSPTCCRARASRRASPPATAPTDIEALIDDEHPRGVLREHRQSGRQHLRHRGARRGRAPARRAADRRQHRGDADPAAPDRARRRHRRAFADQVHGRPRHHDGRRDRRQRPLRLDRATPSASRCSASRTSPITAWSTPSISARSAYHRALPQRLPAHHRRGAGAAERLPAAAGHRDRGAAHRAPRRERAARSPNSCARDPRVDWVNYAGFADSPYYALAQKYLGGQRLLAADLRRQGRLRGRQALLRRAEAVQAAGQHRRRQVARLPSGLDHASADDAGRAAQAPACGPR